MTLSPEPKTPGVASFRSRLLAAMMVVVTVVAVATLLYTQRNLSTSVRAGFEREFQVQLAALHDIQDFRDAALAERCRVLARKPRIHAALEDGAPDLLYPSARDEMRGLMSLGDGPDREGGMLRALYYRFLDSKGRVISPPDPKDVARAEPRPRNRRLRSLRFPTARRQATSCIPRAPRRRPSTR